MARQGRSRSREEESIQRGTDHRHPEGIGGGSGDGRAVPAAWHHAGVLLPLEGEVRRKATRGGPPGPPHSPFWARINVMSERTLALANDPVFAARIQKYVADLDRKRHYHSLELNDGTVLPGLIGVEALRARVRAFPIPEDLIGRRVLDVGAASGWNAFEMERRGAEVVAVDCVEYSELREVGELRGSRIDYRLLDVDELDPAGVGTFDCILFFGVLYHLRHPLLGLERICALARDSVFIESFVADGLGERSDACTMEFYETDELGGQIDNWFGPTTKCLMAMCRSAGFAQVKLEYVGEGRAGITCRRRWEAPMANPAAAPPYLCSAVNNRTIEPTFHRAKDEYMCLYFRSRETLTRSEE